MDKKQDKKTILITLPTSLHNRIRRAAGYAMQKTGKRTTVHSIIIGAICDAMKKYDEVIE